MKQFILSIATVSFMFIAFALQAEKQRGAVQKPPNIIFILTDDLGYGDIGVLYQNQRQGEQKPYHKTPHLDRMAGQGMLLTRHYVPAPVCAPSRASLLLGVHQGHAEIRNNQFDKALPDNHTLASVLKQAGYATAVIGKWGLQGLEGQDPASWEAYPTKRGFDHFFGYVRHRDGHNHYPAHQAPDRPPVQLYAGSEEISRQLKGCYTTDLFTAAAKNWIVQSRQQNPEKPFFLYLAYDTPHAGLQVAAAPYPEGGGVKGGVQWIGEEGNFINTAEDEIDDYIHPDYAEKKWPETQKRFASMVRRIDNAVGDLFQLLEDLQLEQETLIVFTSDNGPHKESYGYGAYDPTFFDSYGSLDGIKRDTWEGGIRVPTLVRWSGHIPAGESSNSPSGFHDWLPTFAELAGLPAPARTDGVSLVPVLYGQDTRKDGHVYIEYSQGDPTPDYDAFDPSHRNQLRGEMQVIYLDGYKGVRYNIKSADDDFRIYDTQQDQGEKNNLSGSKDYFVNLQQQMKDKVLRMRRPNPTAYRPYDSVPMPALRNIPNREEGLQYRVFHAATPWTPNTATLQEDPAKTGICDGFKLSVRSRKENIVIDYHGLLEVPATGMYTFSLQADRGAVLRIHEATVIDADKLYAPGSVASGEILLEKGLHPVQLVYARNQERSAELMLQWSGPGFAKSGIGPKALSHVSRQDQAKP